MRLRLEPLSKADGREYFSLLAKLHGRSYRVCNLLDGTYEFYPVSPQERRISIVFKSRYTLTLYFDINPKRYIELEFNHVLSFYSRALILLEFLYAPPE